jgi:hypothetical protein
MHRKWLLCRDYDLAAPTRRPLGDFDADVASQGGQKTQQAITGESRDSAMHELRHFGLIDSKDAGDLRLAKLLSFDDFCDSLCEFGA